MGVTLVIGNLKQKKFNTVRMKLYEIIEKNDEDTSSVLIESMHPYKKTLKSYYQQKMEDPIMMITSVTNTTAYGKIVPAGKFNEAICAWLEVPHIVTDEDEEGFDEELFAEWETISANSIPLAKW